jgi:hypothetical protein
VAAPFYIPTGASMKHSELKPNSGETLKVFSVGRQGTRQEYLCLPLFFCIVLKVLDREIRQEKEIKGNQT